MNLSTFSSVALIAGVYAIMPVFSFHTVRVSQDLRRIGQLRYHVFESEAIQPSGNQYLKNMFYNGSNHVDKTTLVELDKSGINLVLVNDSTGSLDGCVHLNLGGDLQKSMGNFADSFDIRVADLPGVLDQSACFVSRFAVAPDKRGTILSARLCAEAFRFARGRKASWAYAVTSSELTTMYKKLGFIVFAQKDLGDCGSVNLIGLDLTREHLWLKGISWDPDGMQSRVLKCRWTETEKSYYFY